MAELTSAVASLSKATGLGTAAVKSSLHLLERLLGKPCDAVGEAAADQISFWQWQNRLRIAAKAEKIIAEERLAERVVPPAFLIPLLQAAGNTDDDAIQGMWARLLTSGIADDEAQHPRLINLLKQLSPRGAKLFELIARGLFKLEARYDRDCGSQQYVRRDEDAPMVAKRLGCSASQLYSSLYHLHDLGIVIPDVSEESIRVRNGGRSAETIGKVVYTYAMLTDVGIALASACIRAECGLIYVPQSRWNESLALRDTIRTLRKKADDVADSVSTVESTADEAKDKAEELEATMQDLRAAVKQHSTNAG